MSRTKLGFTRPISAYIPRMQRCPEISSKGANTCRDSLILRDIPSPAKESMVKSDERVRRSQKVYCVGGLTVPGSTSVHACIGGQLAGWP